MFAYCWMFWLKWEKNLLVFERQMTIMPWSQPHTKSCSSHNGYRFFVPLATEEQTLFLESGGFCAENHMPQRCQGTTSRTKSKRLLKFVPQSTATLFPQSSPDSQLIATGPVFNHTALNHSWLGKRLGTGVSCRRESASCDPYLNFMPLVMCGRDAAMVGVGWQRKWANVEARWTEEKDHSQNF